MKNPVLRVYDKNIPTQHWFECTIDGKVINGQAFVFQTQGLFQGTDLSPALAFGLQELSVEPKATP